jgi:hypothetical protein
LLAGVAGRILDRLVLAVAQMLGMSAYSARSTVAFVNCFGSRPSFGSRTDSRDYEIGHPPCLFCFGGHWTEPNEQNTQQSPRRGRRRVLHFVHS